MGIFKKKNFVKIEKDDLKDAKLSTADFSDEQTKKRAFTNVLGARLAIKMLFSKKIEANNVYSLYTIQNVLKDLDIADIYYNGIKIDVRLVFNRKEVFIPKSHFQQDLLPDLYLMLELKQDFSGAECLGFFEPKNLNKDNANKEFYFVEEEELQDAEKIKSFLNDFKGLESRVISSEQDLQNAEALFIASADNEISQENKNFLFKQLAASFDLREKFVEFENFEIISTKVAKNGDLLEDGVLGIVGAQQLFEEDELNYSQQESKAVVIEEALTDLIEEADSTIGIKDESDENDSDSEDFMQELLDNKNKNESNSDKDGDSNLGGVIAGTVAGAIAGAAAAGAASTVISGLASQETTLKAGADILSSGIDLASSLAKGGLEVLSETVSQVEELVDADNIEIIEDDSFFSEIEESSNEVEENDFNFDELESLLEKNDEVDDDVQEIDYLDELVEEEVSEISDIDELLSNDDILTESEQEELSIDDEQEPSEFLAELKNEVSEELVEETSSFDFNELEDLLDENDLSGEDTPKTEEIEPLDEIVEIEAKEEEPEIEDSEVSDIDESLSNDDILTESELEELNEEDDQEPSAFVEELGNESGEELIEETNSFDFGELEDLLVENVDAGEALGVLEEINHVEEIAEIENVTAVDEILENEKEEKSSDAVSEEILSPVDDIQIIEEDMLPIFEGNEELMPNSNLLGGLPELALEFDSVVPTYLQGIQEPEVFFTQEPESESEQEQLEEVSNNKEGLRLLVEEPEAKEDLITEKAIEPEPEVELEQEVGEDEEQNKNEFSFKSEFSSGIDEDDFDLNIGLNQPVSASDDGASIEDSVLSDVGDFLKNMGETSISSEIEASELDDINLDFLNQDEASPTPVLAEDMNSGVVEEPEVVADFSQSESLQMLFQSDKSEMPEMFSGGQNVFDIVKKDKKVAIAASVAGIMLIALVAGGITKSQNSPVPPSSDIAARQIFQPETPQADLNQDPANLNMNAQDPNAPMGAVDNQALDVGQSQDLGAGQSVNNKDMNQAVSDAFLSEPVNATITKVAWEVPEDLAYNDGFRKYLQMAGKNLKLNLQNDLLLVNDMAYSNKVIVDLTLGQDGSLTSSSMVSSSGSKQIDKVVLQSVKNTLSYLKMPASELNKGSANVTLIINF